MFEKSLAPYNRLGKIICNGLLLLILTFLVFQFVNITTSETILIILSVLYLILIALIVKGYKSHDIYYDDNNMYLKGSKGVLTVPFSKVKKVKMTLAKVTIMGLKFYQYKIEYFDTTDRLREIQFWTSIISKEIDEFGEKVKQINGNFKVEHWATS